MGAGKMSEQSQLSLFSDTLSDLLQRHENENLEFKEAKNNFDFEELVRYCAALANERGGKLLLGVNDNREVVGSSAFKNLERTKSGLVERLHLRVTAEELPHPLGRVVVFTVPPRPLGVPVQYKGAFWMRSGDALVAMTQDQIKNILNEAGPDYSAEICPGAALDDLEPVAIAAFRRAWARKADNPAILTSTDRQLLTDAELIVDGALTYAALVLLGKSAALGRFLGQAEIIFEYRGSEASGPPQQRKEFRTGFLLYQDELWETINARNEVQHFQYGLFIFDIHTFNRAALREAILNAVSHRDYRLAGSTFIRQFARRIEVISPGGFPPGITEENCLWRQLPRNRRIAETLGKMGLVDRSGQGMNRIVEECIKESKPKPDFHGTDDFQVYLSLRGDIQDPRFLAFLEKVGQRRLAAFSTEDLLLLDLLYREQEPPDRLRARLVGMAEAGIVEKVGKGRGARFLLSRRFYEFLGKPGTYTRQRGLDRDTNKELLLKHLSGCEYDGCQARELMQVLPHLSREEVKRLLNELRVERRVHLLGRTKAGRWYPGQAPAGHFEP
jgi:ATP-dependent DNA helicase RecG